MSQNDKIYDLFRRNAHQLDEKPSSRVWERLETKLNQEKSLKKGTKRTLVLRYSGIAAAVALMVAILTFVKPWESKQQARFAVLERPSATLMDFNVEGNQVSYLRMVAYQKEYDKLFKRLAEEKVGTLKPKLSTKITAPSSVVTWDWLLEKGWKKTATNSYKGQAVRKDGKKQDFEIKIDNKGTFLMLIKDGEKVSYLMTLKKANKYITFENKSLSPNKIILENTEKGLMFK